MAEWLTARHLNVLFLAQRTVRCTCSLLLQCSFTITSRDAQGNKRFTSGADEWDVTVKGVEGWAAEGRIGEFVYPADAPLSASTVSW